MRAPNTRIAARIAALTAAVALAACADGALYDVTDIPPGPPPNPPAADPQIVVELDRPTDTAKRFIEDVSARCWLDGVIQAGAMLVDRNSGRIVLVGETEDLLVVDFLPTDPPDAYAQMRLSGPVLTNADKTAALLEHLTRAERTGEIACPPLGAEGNDSPVIADG
ncbi:MAG: hypothetical protein AAF677_10530 [Pseudomonadota bacterium]